MKFYDTIKKYKKEKINLFFDMDGVLIEYDMGNVNYSTLRPLKTNIKILKKLSKKSNIEVFILSVCDDEKIAAEKYAWFERNANFVKRENLIFLLRTEEPYQNLIDADMKVIYLNKNLDLSKVNILVEDDNNNIKAIMDNIKDIILFQDSSLIK
ncbi:MAG: hypothetical protein R3Y21_03925 [Mycoplasmatota bacterium]